MTSVTCTADVRPFSETNFMRWLCWHEHHGPLVMLHLSSHLGRTHSHALLTRKMWLWGLSNAHCQVTITNWIANTGKLHSNLNL